MIPPRHDLAALARTFAIDGRVQVPDFLEPTLAERLHQRIASWPEWALVTRIGGQHRSFDAAGMDALEPDRRSAFEALVAAEARAGFQYLYERIPLYDLGRVGRLHDTVLAEAWELLRSAAFLGLARQLAGAPGIAFADGQLTRYRRGHFLTLHDDHADGAGRVAAFVLNLTPAWAADFGGQLQFTDAGGRVVEAIAPRFNTLTLFAVPRPHLVTAVAPFVSGSRYALTGWLRSGAEVALPQPAEAAPSAA